TAGNADYRQDRAQVYYPSPAALAHAGTECPRAQERTLEVDRDHCVPIGFGKLGSGATNIDTGIIHQNVDRAERSLHFFPQSFDLSSQRHIGGESDGPAAGRYGDLLGGYLTFGQFSAGNRYIS